MRMYVNGQDIRRFAIAEIGATGVRVLEETSPEHFLRHLHDFLKEQGKTVQDITEFFVVVGPGSATALRSILSIANTMAFVGDFDLVGVVKPQDESDDVTIANIEAGRADLIRGKSSLDAIYEHGPRITISKKDKLKRS